ncbi:hypothetical protein AAVH_21130, partial [Aphelenchoides avenae]
SFEGEPIDFILRRVEIWKEADRRQMRMYLKHAFGKLLVDFCTVPAEYLPRVNAVPAWRQCHKPITPPKRALPDPLLAPERSVMTAWLQSTCTKSAVVPDQKSLSSIAPSIGDDATEATDACAMAAPAAISDDFWNDSPDMVGEWALPSTAPVPDDFWNDSPDVIGEWALPSTAPVPDDFWDDSPNVIGEWALPTPASGTNESYITQHSGTPPHTCVD